jgi:proline racemase
MNEARIKTIDAHTAGEPLRLVVEGLPPVPGETILEKRAFMKSHFDDLRTALMLEPRGHADMYGCVLTEPVTPDGDLGVLFLHNEGYSTMCGHGVIALVTIAIERGLVKIQGERPVLRLDTPAGRVTATAEVEMGRVAAVSFLNVPSFVLHRDLKVTLPDGLEVVFDVAYGGAFYAIGSADQLDLALDVGGAQALIQRGMQVKRAVTDAASITHPFDPDLGFLYGTIFTGSPGESGSHSRNVCIFAEGELDRSPTGTGVSARAALHYAKGELGLGETIRIESILGTSFEVEAVEEQPFGPHAAIVPRVRGRAFITGESEFILDPADPLRDGFLIR